MYIVGRLRFRPHANLYLPTYPIDSGLTFCITPGLKAAGGLAVPVLSLGVAYYISLETLHDLTQPHDDLYNHHSVSSSHPNTMANMYPVAPPQYSYSVVPPPPPRPYSGHGTSSAFSSSANPDEDWTKISDLAERRRIQNRIAQRNYRKKLKRRLEDLERRAGPSDGSSGSEKQSPPPSTKSTKKSSPKAKSTMAAPQKPLPPPQYTPPMTMDDEFMMQPTYDEARERSHTPPYMAYSAYPPPDEMLLPPYGSAAPYQMSPMTTAEGYPTYMASTVPCTLPSMTHFSDAIKREAYPEESLSPYVHYNYVPSVEVNAHSHYEQHSNPHTPPLTHSFDHSANCSDAGYDYPTTPLSMPGSPGVPHH